MWLFLVPFQSLLPQNVEFSSEPFFLVLTISQPLYFSDAFHFNVKLSLSVCQGLIYLVHIYLFNNLTVNLSINLSNVYLSIYQSIHKNKQVNQKWLTIYLLASIFLSRYKYMLLSTI